MATRQILHHCKPESAAHAIKKRAKGNCFLDRAVEKGALPAVDLAFGVDRAPGTVSSGSGRI
jgi:hypothetical protein